MDRKELECFDINFIRKNLNLIDGIKIDERCHDICKHNVFVHLNTRPSNEWIEFENKIDTKLLLPFYDLISTDFRKHFSWSKDELVSQLKTKYSEFLWFPPVPPIMNDNILIYLLIERMNHLFQEKINEKNRINDLLRNEIKELNQEIARLKFKVV